MADIQHSEHTADIPALTGLRFFAALSIFVGHFLNSFTFSPFGSPVNLVNVTVFGMPLFFVLSGFVIHLRYGQAISSKDKVAAIAEFGGARFARLAPLFFFFFVIYLFAQGHIFTLIEDGEFANFVALGLTGMFTWLPVWYHHHLQIETFFGVSWSISTEIFFYISYPIYGGLLWRTKSPWRLAILMTTLCVLAFGWLWIVYDNNAAWQIWASHIFPGFVSREDDWPNSFYRWFVYVSPYTRIFEFFLGALTAQFYLRLREIPISSREQKVGSFVTTCAVVVLFGVFFLLICAFSPTCRAPFSYFSMNRGFVSFLHLNFLFAVPIAALIFCISRYPTTISRLLSTGPIIYLGEISYSLYLSHPLADQLLDAFPQGTQWWPRYAFVVLKVLFTVILSVGTYTLIEFPARRWLRQQFRRIATDRIGSGAMALSCLLPFAVALTLVARNYLSVLQVADTPVPPTVAPPSAPN